MSANRRHFLKILGTFPFAAGLFRRAGAANATTGQARRMVLNIFSIAGFQFYDGPALVHRLKPDDEIVHAIGNGSSSPEELVQGVDPHDFRSDCRLDLRAEPENPHDPFAVEIFFQTVKLGYVPRSDNRHISRLLLQGASLDCRVIAIDPEAGFRNMVRVEVGMVTPKEEYL